SLMSMPFTLAVRTHTRNAPTIMPAAPSRLSTSRTARLPHPWVRRAGAAVYPAGYPGAPYAGSLTTGSRGLYAGSLITFPLSLFRALFPAGTTQETRGGRRSASEFHGADLSHHRDLDLAGVLQLLLDLLRDVSGQDLGGQVVHILRLHHHADLTPCLHGEGLFDAGIRRADLLQSLEPLDVGLERLSPGALPPARDSVRGPRQP